MLGNKIAPSGIKRRWMINNLLVFLTVVVIAVLLVSVFIVGYYYDSMAKGLETKAKIAVNFFAAFTTKTSAEYYDGIYKYTTEFGDASTIELQFVNAEGRVEASSYSLAAGLQPGTDEIARALETNRSAVFRGKNADTGERIMAVSYPLMQPDGNVAGVLRYVTSLKTADREITVAVLIAIAVGAVLMLIIVLTNMFFIRSVVGPVNKITQVARRIAGGSYGIQIDGSYKDEIGEMVTAINEMSVKIGQTEKTQSEFVSSVSHELRTPLTAITGWAETLMYDENLDPETRDGIGIMLKEARRLTKMVEELLEFTRMQDGRFTLNAHKIDVGAELEDSIFTYRELFKQDDITLEYLPPDDDMPIINGDPERLRQVFLNILDNAAKYGHDGKRIVVAIEHDDEAIRIKIRDFGPGIPEEELENVKKRFFKMDAKTRGSGIGLAVVDEIVKYHNGTLTLENAPEGGLLVTVSLPVE